MTSFIQISSIVLTSVALASVCVADTLTVDDDGKADFNNIQAAINASSDGDEIIVAPGTYFSKQDAVVRLNGKSVWLHSSGGSNVTFIDGLGFVRGLICVDGETSSTHIQGFTIQNCRATQYDWDEDGTIESWERSGGGMGNANSSPMVSDCVFLYNDGSAGGGGMFNFMSSPTVNNCSFQGNTVGNNASGGGMYNRNSSNPQLTGCSFVANQASVGGGMYNYDGSSPSLQTCAFTKNSAELFGGGMYCRYLSSPTLASCDFDYNDASQGGGGMYNSSLSDPVLTDCNFNGNTTTGGFSEGGGIGNLTSSPTLTNCTFTNNNAGTEGAGGGMAARVGCDPTLSNCTFAGNGDASIFFGGGLYFDYFCNPVMTDCLIESNESSGGGGGLWVWNYCNVIITGCTIELNTTYNWSAGIGGDAHCNIALTSSSIQLNIAANGGDATDIYLSSNTSLTGSGINTVGNVRLDEGCVLSMNPEAEVQSDGDVSVSTEGAVIIGIDDLNTTTSILADGELNRAGSLSVTNNSGSLLGAVLGDVIPLIQAGTLVSEFVSVMFPVMPDGLGLQLVESPASDGSATEIAMEVVAVEGAEFDLPVGADLPGPPVGVLSLDIDNDGKDEIAYLLGGSPGTVVVYSVTGDGNAPVLIQGLQVNVGNNPVDLDVADLNGDGNDDLLVANASGTTLNVLLVDDGRSTEHSFNVLTIDLSSNDPSLLTCAAIIDWDGDSDLDAVVGVDVIDESTEDRYEVVLDIATNSPASGPSFDIPMYQIGSVDVADAPTCVDGVHGNSGINNVEWGFVGGTTYGRLHRTDPNRAILQDLGSLGGNKVATIELKDLDVDGGDGIVDLMASSGDAMSAYLMQGEVERADGFGDLIPLNVGDVITDIISIDVDRDGDMDYLIATPESSTSLVLLRNDGSTEVRDQKLSGQSYNRQNINTTNPVTKVTGGGLSDKDEEDDWTGGGHQSGALFAGLGGTMDQINIILPTPPDCSGDFNGDNSVDITDLLSLIAAWGTCESCPEDVNTDGAVDVSDLLALIAAWGPC